MSNTNTIIKFNISNLVYFSIFMLWILNKYNKLYKKNHNENDKILLKKLYNKKWFDISKYDNYFNVLKSVNTYTNTDNFYLFLDKSSYKNTNSFLINLLYDINPIINFNELYNDYYYIFSDLNNYDIKHFMDKNMIQILLKTTKSVKYEDSSLIYTIFKKKIENSYNKIMNENIYKYKYENENKTLKIYLYEDFIVITNDNNIEL